jgi:DNA-binding transcriptional LysR family regulator
MSYVNNIRMFVRVYELGSMSAAARDQRTSPAVAFRAHHPVPATDRERAHLL